MRTLTLAWILSLAAAQDGLQKEEEEAVDLLQQLLRIDTINPPQPGSAKANADETVLCKHVQKILAADGVDAQIYESAPGRGNLVARYKGNGEKKPLLLMAHIDVVNVDPSKWDVDPLSGTIKDGYLWGRGALDDKDDAAVYTQVLRILARRKTKLKRDVILMLNADEESMGSYGAKWMIDNHWDKIACEYVFNEAGRTYEKNGRVLQVGIETAEKMYNDFRIWIRGKTGHSSIPLAQNAIYDAARLLAKAETFKTPVRVTETVRMFLQQPIEEGMEGFSDLPPGSNWGDLMKKAAAGDLVAAEALCAVPRFNALLRSTFVPTILHSGIRVNILPPDVEITFNARLLPGDSIDRLIKDLMVHMGIAKYAFVEGDAAVAEKWKKTNKDADAAVFLLDRGVDAPATSVDTEAYRALVRATQKTIPGISVVPRMTPGATDSRFLRLKGIACYGFDPCPIEDGLDKTMHGNNERISVESVKFGLRFALEAVLEACR